MSAADRLANLEAQTWANTQKVEALSTQKHELTAENIKQQDLIARYEEEFNKPDLNHQTPAFSPTSSESRTHILHEPFIHRLFPPPGPLPTPFYLAARDACQLQLAFVVPGHKGETLEVPVNNVDLAFILEQTLKRRGWSDLMAARGVEDFLEQPMMKIIWRGREGGLGVLS